MAKKTSIHTLQVIFLFCYITFIYKILELYMNLNENLSREEKYIDDCGQYMRNKKLSRIKANAVSIISTAIYSYIIKRRDQKKDLYSKFINHCDTLIQNHFRTDRK